jgi:hypothetical protein
MLGAMVMVGSGYGGDDEYDTNGCGTVHNG